MKIDVASRQMDAGIARRSKSSFVIASGWGESIFHGIGEGVVSMSSFDFYRINRSWIQ